MPARTSLREEIARAPLQLLHYPGKIQAVQDVQQHPGCSAASTMNLQVLGAVSG